ncbi:MAG: Nif3-like dinuclear metal center hexameric protein [Chthoniobacterales bacterium]|nr:Nif3-like dinuclear metal center hexameric protein [Chthoniobacterales bacterium]
MADLAKVVAYANRYLRVAEVEDYPGAHNGLQVENSGNVKRVLAAVDSGLPALEKAASSGTGSLLVVHHGLFWSGVQPVTGVFRRKLEVMREADMALYSVHLPLDAHNAVGNNVLLAKALGLRGLKIFLGFGRAGAFSGSLDLLVRNVHKATGREPMVCAAGPAKPRKVGVITGGAGDMVDKAAAAGIDTFITGEGPQWSWVRAEELGINVIYAGHYATETFGVKSLAGHLAEKFRVPCKFVDHPVPL